jgi:hypothetical protein
MIQPNRYKQYKHNTIQRKHKHSECGKKTQNNSKFVGRYNQWPTQNSI